jgi:hypothetical protein
MLVERQIPRLNFFGVVPVPFVWLHGVVDMMIAHTVRYR